MALTNDDLLAISHLLDVKLKAEIQPIKNEVQTLKSEIQTLKSDMQSLKSDVQSLKSDVQTLKSDVQTLKSDVQILKSDIHEIKLFQENVLLPRLSTIESCYLSTYHRYRDSVEGYEALQTDNEVMKKVIMEHSEKLQKLA